MADIIFRMENEVEYLSITSWLRENQIEFTVVLTGSFSFPSLDAYAHYAEITVAEADAERVQEAIAKHADTQQQTKASDDEWLERHAMSEAVEGRKERKEGKKRKRTWVVALLALYGLAMTIVAFRYKWIANYEEKNFTHKWDVTGTRVSTYDKKSGQLLSRFSDLNRDGNYEEVEQFNDVLSTSAIDLDENGYIERTNIYDRQKIWVGYSAFDNVTGVWTGGWQLTEDGDTLFSADANQNGLAEWEIRSRQ